MPIVEKIDKIVKKPNPNKKVEYLDKIVVKREEDIPADADRSQYILAAEDYRLRRKNVNENGHIVSKFAMLRMLRDNARDNVVYGKSATPPGPDDSGQ